MLHSTVDASMLPSEADIITQLVTALPLHDRSESVQPGTALKSALQCTWHVVADRTMSEASKVLPGGSNSPQKICRLSQLRSP